MLEVVLTEITYFPKDRNSLYPKDDTVLFAFSIEGGGEDGYIYEHLINNFVTSVERYCNHNGIHVKIVGVTEGLRDYVNQVIESKKVFDFRMRSNNEQNNPRIGCNVR